MNTNKVNKMIQLIKTATINNNITWRALTFCYYCQLSSLKEDGWIDVHCIEQGIIFKIVKDNHVNEFIVNDKSLYEILHNRWTKQHPVKDEFIDIISTTLKSYGVKDYSICENCGVNCITQEDDFCPNCGRLV